MKWTLFFFIFLIIFIIGCSKEITETTTTTAQATTTTIKESANLDNGLGDLNSIEDELDLSELDTLEKDLEELQW